MFYITCGETTQNGTRPPDELPQLVVVDIADRAEICRLKGHTDAIMWAGWSLDDKTIATASWDEHYKLWDASTGECKHTIGPTDGQNWSGAFSPDGKHVMLSGGRPTKVAIYHIQTGAEVKTLETDSVKKTWVRYFSWNPNGKQIAIIEHRSHNVILWEPFEDKVEEVFKLKIDESMLTRFNGMSNVKWTVDGKTLLVKDYEHTLFMWDMEKSWKWRFQRPLGFVTKYSSDMFYMDEMQTVVSLDGDGKVRYWKV